MKFTRLFALLLFFAVCSISAFAQIPTPGQAGQPQNSPTSGGAPGVIRCVNTAQFREGILELKAKREKLNAEFEPKNQKLTNMQNEITGLENELQKQGDVLTPQTREAKMRRLDSLKREYQFTAEETNAAAATRWKDETAAIFDKMDKFFKDFAAKRRITIVVDIAAATQSQVLLYVAPGMNVTKEFIDEYNRAYPVAGANPPAPTPRP